MITHMSEEKWKLYYTKYATPELQYAVKWIISSMITHCIHYTYHIRAENTEENCFAIKKLFNATETQHLSVTKS